MKPFVLAISLLAASVTAVSDIDHEVGLVDSEAVPSKINPEPINHSTRSLISNQRKTTWRVQHNKMRKKYQVEFGGRFNAVKWSGALEDEAQAWAEEIVKTCQNKAPGAGQNPNNFGVNSSVRGGTRIFQSPINVMKTWEKKLELGYPGNQVMTQVLWSGTKYIGCSDAASPVENEKVCTASVCFYGKAGNCLFKKYGNWTEAVIKAPGCSAGCPEDVETC